MFSISCTLHTAKLYSKCTQCLQFTLMCVLHIYIVIHLHLHIHLQYNIKHSIFLVQAANKKEIICRFFWVTGSGLFLVPKTTLTNTKYYPLQCCNKNSSNHCVKNHFDTHYPKFMNFDSWHKGDLLRCSQFKRRLMLLVSEV